MRCIQKGLARGCAILEQFRISWAINGLAMHPRPSWCMTCTEKQKILEVNPMIMKSTYFQFVDGKTCSVTLHLLVETVDFTLHRSPRAGVHVQGSPLRQAFLFRSYWSLTMSEGPCPATG